MIIQILIIALVVYGYSATFWKGHIFEKIGDYLKDRLPEYICKPLFQCPICSAFWYGTAIYFIWGFGFWYHWPLVVVGAMGVNAVIVKITGALDDMADYAKKENAC